MATFSLDRRLLVLISVSKGDSFLLVASFPPPTSNFKSMSVILSWLSAYWFSSFFSFFFFFFFSLLSLFPPPPFSFLAAAFLFSCFCFSWDFSLGLNWFSSLIGDLLCLFEPLECFESFLMVSKFLVLAFEGSFALSGCWVDYLFCLGLFYWLFLIC